MAEVLMDVDTLVGRLDDQSLAIVEVDEDTSAYEKGHVPGAVALDWEKDLHDLPRRDFISAKQLSAVLGNKGVSSDQTIVLYGGNNNWFAAYAYWLFKLRGVEKVVLLDGGRVKWELAGHPTNGEAPASPAVTFTMGAERPELRAFRDEVIEVASRGDGNLVDVRSPAEFSGEVMAPPHLPQEQPYVAGHVPGASNIPWAQAANEDGTFKTVDELRSLYEDKGINGDDPVIAYCRIGERAAHSWFVLSELLGYADVKNFDGSWTEYGSLVGVPVATGPS